MIHKGPPVRESGVPDALVRPLGNGAERVFFRRRGTLEAVTRHGFVVALLLASACGRSATSPTTTPPATPSSPPPIETGESSPPTDAELTPVELASYDGGSSNLLLRDGGLYWVTRRLAPVPAPMPGPTRADGSRASGAVLDCSRTRGDVWWLALEPGARPQRIAETPDWPWSLSADDLALYFIGHCRPTLYRVPLRGGAPEPIGGPDLAAIDVFPTTDGLLVADRFGEHPGIYRLPRDGGSPQPLAGETTKPWLLGRRRDVVYWGDHEAGLFRVHAFDAHGLQMSVGALAGQPTDAVTSGDHLFVLTQQMVAELTPDAVTTLGNVTHYGDRSNLAVDDAYLYWANGKTGTISRIGRDGQGQVEAYFGGEPCCVAADGRFLYWLDRSRKAVMRVHRARFDDPPAVPPPEPAKEEAWSVLEAMPGLSLDVQAKLVRARGRWHVDITATAIATGERTYVMHEPDVLQLTGTTTHADGTGSGFGGGCTSPTRSDLHLRGGQRHVFTRRYPADDDDPFGTGDKLELEVRLCWVDDDEGRTARVNGGTVVVDATGKGKPTLRVVAPEAPE